MKRLLLLTLALIALAGQAATIFEDGYLKYSLNTSNNWVSVVGLSTSGQNLSSVRIPRLATYNGDKYFVKEIASSAFANNTRMTTVVFETGIEKVSAAAFKGCTALSSINLAATNTIANDAFVNCSSLQTIYLASYYPPTYTPASGTKTSGVTVYVPCFKGIIPRYKAKSWNVFSSIKTNDIDCFPIRNYGGGSYGMCVFSAMPYGKAADVIEVEMIVTDLNPDKEGAIAFSSSTLSEYVKFVPRVIADSAFVGRKKLSDITFGPVRTIGQAAFKGCTNLTSVTIPCDTIGASAFEDCSNLATITLRSGVDRILSRAFAGTAITSLALPATVKESSLVVNACNDCPNFVEFTVASANQYYSAVGGLLYTKDRTQLIRCPVGLHFNKWFNDMPDECYYIRAGAFANSLAYTQDNLNYFNITIPYGIQHIGGYAFENARRLAGITIPSTVNQIDQYAFYNAGNLYVATSRETPLSLTTNVFYGSTLKKLYVPVTCYDKYATASYWKNFPVITTGGNDFVASYNNSGARANFIITKAATSSEPGEVKVVYGDFTIECDEIPSTTVYRNKSYKVTAVADSAFAGDTYLRSLTLPAFMRSIPRWAFMNCSNLTTATTAEGFEPASVGYRSFWGSGIQEFTVPTTAKTIQKEAFDNCPSLKKLVFLSPTTTTVYTNAFGVTNPNPDLKVYVSWRKAKDWCDSIAKWSPTPQKYLNAWVSVGSYGLTDFSCYLPLNVQGSNLEVYTATIDETRRNYYVQGNTLYVERTPVNKTTSTDGYLLYGDPGLYYLNRDASGQELNALLRPMHKLTLVNEDDGGYRNFVFVTTGDGEFYHATGNVRNGGAYASLDNRSGKWNGIEYVRLVEKAGIRGDLNGDGQVDVTDVSISIDIVLGKTAFNALADLDGNGDVDVTDVSMIIDIVLGK